MRTVLVQAAIALAVFAWAAGTVPAFAVALPSALLLLVVALVRVRHRPLSRWLADGIRFLARRRTLPTGTGTGTGGAALLSLLRPGVTASSLDIDGADVGVLEDTDGLAAIVRVGDVTALLASAHPPLPPLSTLLPSPARDVPEVCLQVLVSAANAPPSPTPSATSYRQLTEGRVPARQRIYIAVRARRSGGYRRADLERSLTAAVRRACRLLEKAGLPALPLSPASALTAVTEAAQHDPSHSLREGWSAVRLGGLHHATFRVRRWPSHGPLMPQLLTLPTSVTTISLTAQCLSPPVLGPSGRSSARTEAFDATPPPAPEDQLLPSGPPGTRDAWADALAAQRVLADAVPAHTVPAQRVSADTVAARRALGEPLGGRHTWADGPAGPHTAAGQPATAWSQVGPHATVSWRQPATGGASDRPHATVSRWRPTGEQPARGAASEGPRATVSRWRPTGEQPAAGGASDGPSMRAELVVRLAAPSAAALDQATRGLHRLVASLDGEAVGLDGGQLDGLAASLPLGGGATGRAALLSGLVAGHDGLALGGGRAPTVSPPLLSAVEPTLGADGVMLGVDRHGKPLVVRLFRPEPTRAALVGGLGCAQVVILRALGAGAQVVVQSARPRAWELFQRGVGTTEPLSVIPPGPLRAPPPASATRPQLLVVDADLAPARPSPVQEGAWRTVLHLRDTLAPADADLLARCDLTLLQPLKPHEATIAGDALGLAEARAWLTRISPEMLGVVVNRQVVRWTKLSTTPLELQLTGGPAR